MKPLKNSVVVAARTNVLAHCKPIRIRDYVWLGHASIVSDSRSAILLDCNTCSRAAGDQRLGSHSLCGQKRRGARSRRLRHDQPARDRIYLFRSRLPESDVRWIHCGGSKIATDPHIATLQGKIIGITGTIELHQGKPEIKVMSTDQIKP